jgi:hypothetical protein
MVRMGVVVCNSNQRGCSEGEGGYQAKQHERLQRDFGARTLARESLALPQWNLHAGCVSA